MVQVEEDKRRVMDLSDWRNTMKTTKRVQPKTVKVRQIQRTLEESHKQVFVTTPMTTPPKERLSMYKSVPSMTTYGLCEEPQ